MAPTLVPQRMSIRGGAPRMRERSSKMYQRTPTSYAPRAPPPERIMATRCASLASVVLDPRGSRRDCVVARGGSDRVDARASDACGHRRVVEKRRHERALGEAALEARVADRADERRRVVDRALARLPAPAARPRASARRRRARGSRGRTRSPGGPRRRRARSSRGASRRAPRRRRRAPPPRPPSRRSGTRRAPAAPRAPARVEGVLDRASARRAGSARARRRRRLVGDVVGAAGRLR